MATVRKGARPAPSRHCDRKRKTKLTIVSVPADPLPPSLTSVPFPVLVMMSGHAEGIEGSRLSLVIPKELVHSATPKSAAVTVWFTLPVESRMGPEVPMMPDPYMKCGAAQSSPDMADRKPPRAHIRGLWIFAPNTERTMSKTTWPMS